LPKEALPFYFFMKQNNLSGQNNHFWGLAFVISAVALVLFAYLAYIGLDFLLEGNYLLAIAISAVSTIVAIYCLITMCASKASRNKREGLPREIVSLAVCLLIMALGSIPFMKFLYIYEHRAVLKESVANIVTSACELDSAYIAYTDQRLADFNKFAKSRYGSPKLVHQSLERRLVPENIEKISKERKEWLETFPTPSLKNPMTPTNIHALLSSAEKWMNEYHERSALIYHGEKTGDGEPYQGFVHEKTASEIENWRQQFCEINAPDSRAILTSTFVFILIFLSYFHTRRSKNRYEGTH